MATKFYLAEIPDDFPATNVKFENMTKPLLAIPAKMVDGKPITIVGYIDAGQKKYKANDYGFVEFNDNGADFAQFKDANMDTRYSVREKVSGDILGYLPLETGELVGIVREKEKPILLLIIAVIAALVLLVALITASLYKMVNKPLDGSGSDASSASSKIVIAASKALERDIEPLSEDICKRVARDIFNQLWQVLRAEDTEPKSVYIDTDCHCNKLIFPDNPRQVTSAMRAAACGSRTNLPDGNVLRAFLYWKGNDGPDLWNGIDLDLSVVFYGEEKAKFIYYANPKDETLGAVHSGDRRCSGKNGAVEYVDFDIKKCFQNGFRYAALTVKSYSGEKFSEMENAFCGVMVRDGKTGEQFEPATVKDRFALTTDSDQLVMVVIDLMTREVITVDKSVAQFRLACRNVVTDYAPTVAACTYAMQLKSLSIKEMLGMRYAQFLKSDDWKHASVIVSDEPEKFKVTDKDTPAPRIVSPYDIPGIYDLIFGKENQ